MLRCNIQRCVEPILPECLIVFSYDVTAAMLVYQNKGMAAMLVYQTNPPGIKLYFYDSIFFSLSNPVWLLVT